MTSRAKVYLAVNQDGFNNYAAPPGALVLAPILYDTKIYDSDNAYSTSTGKWFPPVPTGQTRGVRFKTNTVWQLGNNNAGGPNSNARVMIMKNGSLLMGSEGRVVGSTGRDCTGIVECSDDIASPGDYYQVGFWAADADTDAQHMTVQGNSSDGRTFASFEMSDN